MRIIRTLGLGFLVWAVPAAAQTADAPCGAIKTTVLPPCDAPAPQAAPAGSALATLDGTPIAAAELGESLRARREGLGAAIAEARRAALQAEIDDVLMDLEASRRGVSLGSLLDTEVTRKTSPPTVAEVAVFYEKWKARGVKKTFEELKPALEGMSRDDNRIRREAEFGRSLRERFPLTMGVDAGATGLAKDPVLATVGGRMITAASAATRLDAAAFGVRRDLYFEEKDAFEKLVRERLLKVEAGKRGLSPEALKKENVRVEEGHAVKFLAELPAAPALSLDLSRGTSRGNPNAAVTVVEYADFQCPPCSRMWATLEAALAPYGDRVRYVYVNFPLPFHEFAQKAAEASLAARAQGKFFEYSSMLFKNQKALDAASLRKYAADLGLDAARFAADLDGGGYAAEVLLDKRSGVRAGVAGTPQVFVNGVWLPRGAREAAEVGAIVDAALRAAVPVQAPGR